MGAAQHLHLPGVQGALELATKRGRVGAGGQVQRERAHRGSSSSSRLLNSSVAPG